MASPANCAFHRESNSRSRLLILLDLDAASPMTARSVGCDAIESHSGGPAPFRSPDRPAAGC
jgi:hypothetical protein